MKRENRGGTETMNKQIMLALFFGVAYVGVTRAKRHLVIVDARGRKRFEYGSFLQ